MVMADEQDMVEDVEPTTGSEAQVTEADRQELAGDSGVSDAVSESAGSPAAAAESEWESVRDAAAGLGYQFGQDVKDDRAALLHLVRQATLSRQSDYYAQLGRQLAPHADAIQGYLRQQQAPVQEDVSPRPWEAPEFDERWAALVERDPGTGLYVGRPGTPPGIVDKVNAFAEWQGKWQRDPVGVIRGAWQEDMKRQVAEQFKEQFAAAQRESQINQIVQANAPWLYQVGADGNRLTDPVTGQAMYTAVGAQYLQQLQALKSAGITDPATQDRLAQQLVQGQYAVQQLQAQQKAGSPQTQQAQARPNTNPLQALGAAERRRTAGATEPVAAGYSLTDMLRTALEADGVSDSDIFNSL